MRWIEPQFENIPSELITLNRWVMWKDNKIPYNPLAINSKASVNDPDTWSSFEQSKIAYFEGGWNGIGFVLNGDGVAGIDIDRCVENGYPDERAIKLLEDLDSAYIEVSPSGTGLRAFGLAKPLTSGKRGVVNGLNVELYSRGRYLTLTGQTIKKEPIRNFKDFEKLASAISHSTEEAEVTECNSSVSSVEGEFNWPMQCIPTKVGQRNKKLFELARWLKGVEPDAKNERQYEMVNAWFQEYLEVIGSKEFGNTWADWRNAWESVQYPYGATLAKILEELPELDHICGIKCYGPKGEKLLKICFALQEHQQDEPIFLSSRKAGTLIGAHFTEASSLLRAFVKEGWIVVVSKGQGNKASRYKVKIKNKS